MTYKIWNKEDEINGVDANRIIDNFGIQPDDEVFLILDNTNSVHFIEISRIIKSVHDLDENLSVEEVAEEYIRIMENEKLQNENNEKEAEDLLKRLDALEEEMSITQDALNEIIFNMMDGE